MKLKTNILFSLLLCGTFATAQNLKLDILPPSVTLGQDSATVSMKMTFNVPQMDTKNHIRLTPVLTDGTRTAELPQILLNGERAHRLYRRTLALNKRRGKADVTPVFTAIPLTDSDQTIHYRASLPAADWIQFATLNLKKEVINGSGEKVQSENIPIPDTAPHIATATDHSFPNGTGTGKLLWQPPPPLPPLFRNTVLFPLLRPHPPPNRISREAMYLPKAMPPMSATRKS